MMKKQRERGSGRVSVIIQKTGVDKEHRRAQKRHIKQVKEEVNDSKSIGSTEETKRTREIENLKEKVRQTESNYLIYLRKIQL